MKVPGSVRDAYEQCHELQDALKERVDGLLRAQKQPRWHYESRVKDLESYALKLETGRVADPLALEDFFACTLVVENHKAVADARALVEEHFLVQTIRPPRAGKTSKRPSDFPFDDLRMYVRWRQDPATPKVPFTNITFEVQIKTFLQHAWGIATHDLVYKADRFSWPLERVAYQIKAMLEHAEVSISRAEDLAQTEILNLDTREFERRQEIIVCLQRHFADAALPPHRARLARTVDELLEGLAIDLTVLENAVTTETALGRGTATLNLSPYGILVQSLLNQQPDLFDKLGGKSRDAFRLFLPREIEGRDQVIAKARDRVVVL